MEPAFIIISFIFGTLSIPLALTFAKVLGFYTVVRESESHVYTLFGKVIGTLSEPGLHFPVSEFGAQALIVSFFGRREVVQTSLRQHYLRNQMVNSEEGTPMGVGIWYEMRVNDPVSYLFKNTNPEGSLRANVASSAISVLSNLEMETLLEDRHSLSRTVREAVSPLSEKWGYRLGSVYMRKVGFTDKQMVDNITEKVVKRLVQVTSAMKQDGDNRVGLIQSETANKVSQKMAEAASERPLIVGGTLNEIAEKDSEVLNAVLEIMETEQMLSSGASVDILPQDTPVMVQLGESVQKQNSYSKERKKASVE